MLDEIRKQQKNPEDSSCNNGQHYCSVNNCIWFACATLRNAFFNGFYSAIHTFVHWLVYKTKLYFYSYDIQHLQKKNNNNFYIEFNADDDDALCCKQQIIKQTTAAVSSWTLRDGWKDRRMDGWMFLFCYFLSLIIFSHIGANLFFAIVSFGVSIKKKNSKWMCCMWVCIFLYL